MKIVYSTVCTQLQYGLVFILDSVLFEQLKCLLVSVGLKEGQKEILYHLTQVEVQWLSETALLYDKAFNPLVKV